MSPVSNSGPDFLPGFIVRDNGGGIESDSFSLEKKDGGGDNEVDELPPVGVSDCNAPFGRPDLTSLPVSDIREATVPLFRIGFSVRILERCAPGGISSPPANSAAAVKVLWFFPVFRGVEVEGSHLDDIYVNRLWLWETSL